MTNMVRDLVLKAIRGDQDRFGMAGQILRPENLNSVQRLAGILGIGIDKGCNTAGIQHAIGE